MLWKRRTTAQKINMAEKEIKQRSKQLKKGSREELARRKLAKYKETLGKLKSSERRQKYGGYIKAGKATRKTVAKAYDKSKPALKSAWDAFGKAAENYERNTRKSSPRKKRRNGCGSAGGYSYGPLGF